jgi:hypothetical protein
VGGSDADPLPDEVRAVAERVRMTYCQSNSPGDLLKPVDVQIYFVRAVGTALSSDVRRFRHRFVQALKTQLRDILAGHLPSGPPPRAVEAVLDWIKEADDTQTLLQRAINVLHAAESSCRGRRNVRQARRILSQEQEDHFAAAVGAEAVLAFIRGAYSPPKPTDTRPAATFYRKLEELRDACLGRVLAMDDALPPQKVGAPPSPTAGYEAARKRLIDAGLRPRAARVFLAAIKKPRR